MQTVLDAYFLEHLEPITYKEAVFLVKHPEENSFTRKATTIEAFDFLVGGDIEQKWLILEGIIKERIKWDREVDKQSKLARIATR